MPSLVGSEMCIRDRKTNNTVHFGHVSPLCFRKHSEFEEKHHQFKGRAIFRGDNVKDQDNTYAVSRRRRPARACLQPLDSSTSLDCCLGIAASSRISLAPTLRRSWVGMSRPGCSFRRACSPRPGKKYTRPVCKLRLALCGHPLSCLLYTSPSPRD